MGKWWANPKVSNMELFNLGFRFDGGISMESFEKALDGHTS